MELKFLRRWIAYRSAGKVRALVILLILMLMWSRRALYDTLAAMSSAKMCQQDVTCVTSEVIRITYPICVIDQKLHVFGQQQELVQFRWNDDRVVRLLPRAQSMAMEKIESLLTADPDATFIDLGANIGTFTLHVAHLGFQV